MSYMPPEYMKKKCINKNKGTCKHVITETMTSVNGKKFVIYYCNCEDELCAGCIPEFESDYDYD